MTNREYYNKITTRLKAGIKELQELQDEYKHMVSESKSDKYTYDYKRELFSKLSDKRHEINARKEQIEREMAGIAAEYKGILRKKDALDASQITDDINILKTGVKLNKRDIDDIIERNPNNRTMAQLCVRYARENGIEGYEHAQYVSAEAQGKTIDDITGVCNTILKWHDKPEACDRMYNRLLGVGSEVANYCDYNGEE